MILPETDHWKHQYLIDLIDENALSLITSLTEASKRLPTIRDYVQIPDAPELGPELLAELHLHAIHQHQDPEWISAHQGARRYYLARAEGLFDRGQSVLVAAGVFSDPRPVPGHAESDDSDPELAEWDALAGQVSELMAIWEDCGRSPAASTQLLLLTQVIPERLRYFATGITFTVLEFNTAGHNLTTLRPSKRSEALALGADSAIRLARLLPHRSQEFRTRALVLAFQALGSDSSGTGPAVASMQYVAAEAAEPLRDTDPRHEALAELADAAKESVFNGFDFSPPTRLAGRLDLPDPGYLDSAAYRRSYRLGQNATRFPNRLPEPDESPDDTEDPGESGNLGETEDPREAVWRLDFMLMMSFGSQTHLIPGRDYDPDSLRSQTLVAMSRAVKQRELQLDPSALRYLIHTSGLREPDLDAAKELLDRSKHWVHIAPADESNSQILAEVIDLLTEAAEQRMPTWLVGLLLDRGEDRLGITLYLHLAKREALMDPGHPAQPFFSFINQKALDRLASIASSVDRFRTEPRPPETRSDVEIARACLLEMLEYPALAASALSRIPLHRLTDSDREQMGETLSVRLEVFTGDQVTDPEFWATEAVELTLLRAIDHAEGAPWMYDLEEEEE